MFVIHYKAKPSFVVNYGSFPEEEQSYVLPWVVGNSSCGCNKRTVGSARRSGDFISSPLVPFLRHGLFKLFFCDHQISLYGKISACTTSKTRRSLSVSRPETQALSAPPPTVVSEANERGLKILKSNDSLRQE